jgi:hypothetical protein
MDTIGGRHAVVSAHREIGRRAAVVEIDELITGVGIGFPRRVNDLRIVILVRPPEEKVVFLGAFVIDQAQVRLLPVDSVGASRIEHAVFALGPRVIPRPISLAVVARQHRAIQVYGVFLPWLVRHENGIPLILDERVVHARDAAFRFNCVVIGEDLPRALHVTQCARSIDSIRRGGENQAETGMNH